MSNNVVADTTSDVIWVVVLGFNNVVDTVECLKSIHASEGIKTRLVFVDNDSKDDSVARVLAELPSATVLQTGKNLGFSRGYNVGMDYCYRHGARYVLMINNDTVVDTRCLIELLNAAKSNPQAGLLVPKIYYFDHPKTVWSAGSRFRAFPPAIIMRKTKGDDDGRYDRDHELDFATTCALLVTRDFFEKVGLLDTDYFILYDDYDWSIRCREAGLKLIFVPKARLWHKVSKSTGMGTRKPFVWTHYGRSTAFFFRKHSRYRWMTGSFHLVYILARMILEGTYFGVKPFLQGYREASKLPVHVPPVPGRDQADRCDVIRED